MPEHPLGSVRDGTYVDTTTAQTSAGVKTWSGSQRVTSGEPQYDVRGFGPVDTANNRRATLQAAMNAWGATGGKLNLHGAYDISGGSVTLPALSLSSHTVFEMCGSADAELSTTSANPLIDDSVPADVTTLVARANRRFIFQNMRLKGNGNAAQTLLRVIGSYGTQIENVAIQSGGDGIDLVFALQPRIVNCKAVQNIGRSMRIRSATGIVTGATGSNSGSNVAHVVDWRDYCSAAQPASIHLFEADGAVIDNLIIEGANPVNGVYMDANSNTTVKSLTIRGYHHENTASQSAVRIVNMSGGNCRIDDVFYQTSQTIIDSSGCTSAMTLFASIPYYVSTSTPFKGDASGNGWVFLHGDAGVDPRSSALWVGGVVPNYMSVLRFSNGVDALGGQYPIIDGGVALLAQANFLRLWGGTGAFQGVYVGKDASAKIGLFGTTAVGRPARAGQLTDSSGGTGGGSTVAAVTDVASAANAIATIVARLNSLEGKISAAGTGIGVTA